jgi:hypothetical protein
MAAPPRDATGPTDRPAVVPVPAPIEAKGSALETGIAGDVRAPQEGGARRLDGRLRAAAAAALRSIASLERRDDPDAAAVPLAAPLLPRLAAFDAGDAPARDASAVSQAPVALPSVTVASLDPRAFARLGGMAASESFPVPSAPIDLGPFTGEPHEQMVKAVHLQWQRGVGEARVTLQPEHLGQVSVTLRVEQGTVTAVMRADNPAAAEWIQAHRAELRSALTSQGLDLESLDVAVDPEGRRRQPPPRDEPPPRHRRRPEAAPLFDVHV